MLNGLRWSLVAFLMCICLVAAGPAAAQNPLETLQDHEVANDGKAAAATKTVSATATASAGSDTSKSGIDKFFERINALFAKLNALASRVNELMDRLAKAKSKQTIAVSPAKNAAPASTAKPSSSPASNESANVSGVAGKVAQVAASFPRRYATAQSFKYAPGTENGNLGCANVVSAALREAGVPIGMILNCDGVKNALLGLKGGNAWKRVSPPPYQAGDVVIWKAPSGGRHKHIGIVAKNGNSLMAMNNSSSKRHPVFSAIEYRPIEIVLRKA
ncbi:MAG TPA: hypothetical protein VIV61_03865 [Candidatus Ozemobacteraceae bacterium]